MEKSKFWSSKRDERLCMDFQNLENVEISLIDMAHNASVDDDPVNKARGRAMKALVPAWVQFLRGEFERDDPYGPANVIGALVKIYAMQLAMTLLPAAKSPESARLAADKLIEDFEYTLKGIVEHGIDMTKQKKDEADGEGKVKSSES